MEKTENQRIQFLQLYAMILADGIVDQKEIETLYRIGKEDYGIDPKDINVFLVEAGNTQNVPGDPKQRIQLLYEMALIAWADGHVDENERALLRRYALHYEVKEEHVDELVNIILEQAENNVPTEVFIKNNF